VRLFITLILSSAVTSCVGCNGTSLQGVRPNLLPLSSPVEFGTSPVLNSKSLEIPLTNVGRAKLSLEQVTLSSDGGVFRITSAPDVVESGDTQNIVLVFTPLEERHYEDTLTFETDDVDNAMVSLSLVGEGSTRAAIEVQPTALDFGRVAECGSSVQVLTILSKGTADLIVNDIAFTDETPSAFSFVGSTRTPAVVKATQANGLPGQIQLTVRLAPPAGATGPLQGGIRLRTTDPEHQELVVGLSAMVNRAPVAVIAPLGNSSPGQRVTLDGSGSMDPDNDVPLDFKWTIRSKPLASTTTIAAPQASATEMTLDPMVPGAYEVQLDVTDAAQAKSCQSARATVVAAPAQKLLVEMFWDNAGTDIDLHVLRETQSPLFVAPDDCNYQNRTPDWGVVASAMDDPELVRDALTGYGPEVFGYVNPINSTYRVLAIFQSEHLQPMPASKVTVRVYLYGVLKAEVSRTLERGGTIWEVADVSWPSGDVTVLP
jgi:hypothetical protein